MTNDHKGSDQLLLVYLAPLAASITPFFLWPIELILPFPFIIEEIAKLILIFPVLLLQSLSKKIILAVLIGLMFSLSETVLYLSNLLLIGDITTLFQRILVTTPLHIITTLVILISGLKHKTNLILGITIASGIHYIFNIIIGK